MKTRITELFRIDRPIIQGGMHYVGFAELAAAVSNAGGLGIITGLTQKTPDDLAREIERCRKMTDKPFGVNLTFLPTVTSPDYPGYIRAIIEGGVTIVETAGRNPEAYLPALKDAGVRVIHKCTSVRHALKAEKNRMRRGLGGRVRMRRPPGRGRYSQHGPSAAGGRRADDPLCRLRRVWPTGAASWPPWPWGADGINMGTRFIATVEAPVHENVKQAIVAATEQDTRLVMRPLRNTERVLNNPAVERLLEKEAALGDRIRFDDIIEEVAGVYPEIMTKGKMDAGAWSCGMVAGLGPRHSHLPGTRRPDHGPGRSHRSRPSGQHAEPHLAKTEGEKDHWPRLGPPLRRGPIAL